MPPLGAGAVEVAPVTEADVRTVREAAAGRSIPVLVRAGDPAAEAALEPYVDGFTSGDDPHLVHVSDPSVTAAAAALEQPGTVVLARPAVLVEAGPGWFARVTEAATPTGPAPSLREVGRDPRRWPAWWWALLVGLGMTGAGLGAAAITLGPVLLWYDRDYLGMTLHELHAANHHLVHFLQHDRITMAGTMVAIGALYTGLAWGGIRRGWPWAREAYLLSGRSASPPSSTSWPPGSWSPCTPPRRSCCSRCSSPRSAARRTHRAGGWSPRGRSGSAAGHWSANCCSSSRERGCSSAER